MDLLPDVNSCLGNADLWKLIACLCLAKQSAFLSYFVFSLCNRDQFFSFFIFWGGVGGMWIFKLNIPLKTPLSPEEKDVDLQVQAEMKTESK